MENTATMTIEEKVARMEALKDEYYDIKGDETEEEAIYEQVKAMELKKVDFVHDENNAHGKFYVCPDTEWEFPHVYEIARENMQDASHIIANAFLEYYRYSDFFDNVDIDRDELVNVRLFVAKVPIIRHAGVSEVELLNVRWLNHNC